MALPFMNADISPQRRINLGQALMQGSRSRPATTGLGALGQALGSYFGGRQIAQGERDLKAEKESQRDALMEALSAQDPTFQSIAQQLAATNPELSSQFAMKGLESKLKKTEQKPQGPIKVGNQLVDPETFEVMFEGQATPGSQPSSVQEWEFFSKLPPDQQEQFLNMKRKSEFLNLGPEFVRASQIGADPTQRLETGLKPGEQPEIKGQQAAEAEAGKVSARAREQWRASQTKLLTNINAASARQNLLSDSIERAKGKLNQLTTGFGSVLGGLPQTEARELRSLIDTIKANVGFGELQSMREASPTGGALGQVSEMELQLLNATLGSLDQANTSEELLIALDQVMSQRAQAVERMKVAYQMDLARYGGGSTGLPPSDAGAEPPLTAPGTSGGGSFMFEETQSLLDKYAP